VVFLNFAGLAHNDIKPDNIVIDTKQSEYPQVTIVDFAYSVKLHFIGKKLKLGRAPGGTSSYHAPERFLDIDYDMRKSDSWSVAVTMYTFYTKKLPYGVIKMETGVSKKKPQYSYTDELKKLYNDYKNLQKPMPLDADLKQELDHTNGAFTELLVVNPKYRQTPEEFVKQWD
jgi:calcium-dependent protein kinase